MKIFHTDVAILTGNLFRLERRGEYEKAFTEVSAYWEDIRQLPEVKGLNAAEAAEVMLRCGSLIGFYGHNKQIPDSQQISKNLLTNARQLFINLNNTEKIADCENYLALAFWRAGELNEADIYITEVLSHNLPDKCFPKLYSLLIKSVIHLSNRKYEEIIAVLKVQEKNFLDFGDDCLKGDFYNYLGIAYQECKNFTKASRYFVLARYYHHRSGHKIYLGTIENNRSQLYKSLKDFEKAHRVIDEATRIFKEIKDKTRAGFSLDTKALIYFEEKKYDEALKTVERAIEMLRESENAAYLVETLQTKTKVLLYLDDFKSAIICLTEAVQIARMNVGEEAVENLAAEFEKILDERKYSVRRENVSPKNSSQGSMNLILPSSLSHYTDIQGIWMENSHLEEIGLKKNSLAIVAGIPVERGDLAAISEKASKAVYCGFYDADFGVVCLEGSKSEPQLFDENEVEIMGKIVGVGVRKDDDPNSEIVISPLFI